MDPADALQRIGALIESVDEQTSEHVLRMVLDAIRDVVRRGMEDDGAPSGDAVPWGA